MKWVDRFLFLGGNLANLMMPKELDTSLSVDLILHAYSIEYSVFFGGGSRYQYTCSQSIMK